MKEIKQIWAETLNISPDIIEPKTHYFDDLDGLSYMQIAYNKFPDSFQNSLLLAELFIHPTLEKLTNHLFKKLNS